MNWAQIALLLSKNITEVPNILAKGKAFLEAPVYQPKNEAFRGVSEAFDPIFVDLDSVKVSDTTFVATFSVVSEEEAEEQLMRALDDGQVHALGLRDRLLELKEIYKRLQPWLAIIGPIAGIPSLPPLPFATQG
jgi:hypothetical protein